jgi:hydrogenase maturation protein HypF
MIDRSINTPMISSCGRLFDAVAAILGINFWSTFQAEAPMRLEAMADQSEKGVYPYEIFKGQVSFKPLIRNLTKDLLDGVPGPKISGRFHNTVIQVIREIIHLARREHQLDRVVLSGGCFQNRILTEAVVEGLRKEHVQVYIPGRIPLNDQGIALGQLAIGAAQLKVL